MTTRFRCFILVTKDGKYLASICIVIFRNVLILTIMILKLKEVQLKLLRVVSYKKFDEMKVKFGLNNHNA